MENTIRRQILTIPRNIDKAAGTADFVASSAALDSYGEVVSPSGGDLSRFEKNSVVIDSHDSSSINNVLGKVSDIRIENGEMIFTVKFAVDVEENDLAKKAFAMICAGYIKACSIGFIPLETCRPGDSDFEDVCEEHGVGDQSDSIACVYVRWQLLELSICCI